MLQISQAMKQVPVVIEKVLKITPGRSALRGAFSWINLVEFHLFPLGFDCLFTWSMFVWF